MTRFLSESLQAKEPDFRLALKNLEQVTGQNNLDIHLTEKIKSSVNRKIEALSLDPLDSRGEEVYEALKQRFVSDDQVLKRQLMTLAAEKISLEARVEDGIIHAIRSLETSKKSFVLKKVVLKRLLKNSSPARTLKKLGIRSIDSALKHQSIYDLFISAWIVEGERWQQSFKSNYKRLTSQDFEERYIELIKFSSKKIENEINSYLLKNKHNVICFKELGLVALLPIDEFSSGLTLSSLAIILNDFNQIRSFSSYLKLKALSINNKFGANLVSGLNEDPKIHLDALGGVLSFSFLHKMLAVETNPSRELENLIVDAAKYGWLEVEDGLKLISSKLDFWENTGYLSFISHGGSVSFNILDNAVNCFNQFSYHQRTFSHFQHSLWHEMISKYISRDELNRTLNLYLTPKFAMEEIYT